MLQGFFVAQQQFQFHLGSLVSTYLGHFLHALDAVFYGFQVFQLQFRIDDFLIAQRVYRTVYVNDVIVFEAAQHVDDGVALADVSQELIAQAFSLAGTLHKAGNVYNVAHSGHNATRMYQFGQSCQSLVGHGYLSHLGVDSTKRKVGCLCLSAAQAVE